MSPTDLLSLSVVSHGQGDLIANLLKDLAAQNWNGGVDFEVIVTLNISEDETWLGQEYPFTVKVIRNDAAKGFGANHNSAFQAAEGSVFMVVNPDIRLEGFQVAPLLTALNQPATGVCGPRVVGPDGALQDTARRFPTFGRLLSRVLLRRRHPDFNYEDGTIVVDWLAGMFLVFKSDIFRVTRGFDERYFMYMEDVEICQNLWQCGFRVLWVSETAVMHDARRASHRNLRHFWWHLTSIVRYFFQRVRKI